MHEGPIRVHQPHTLTATPTRRGWLYLLVPSLVLLLVFAAVGIGADGLRRAVLFLPGTWLAWRWVTSGRRAWLAIAVTWTLVFALDAAVRLYLWVNYAAEPDSVFLKSALANTNWQESAEFFMQGWPVLLPSLLGVLAAAGWYAWLPRSGLWRSHSHSTARPGRIGFGLLLLLATTAYAGSPNRDAHPLYYWYAYPQRVQALEASMEDTSRLRAAWDRNAARDFVAYEGPERQAFVLVLGESVNRFNLQVCGYPRETTPRISALREELTVSCHAWSPAAATVQSLRYKLTSARLGDNRDDEQSTSLLALARQAGFRIYWISNQEDKYTWSLFGNYADSAVFLNRRAGRDGKAFDEAVLPELRAALADAAPRKLIIVHLIGAHPNYQSRYPEQFAHFGLDTNDNVEASLKARGMGLWVRWQRNHYDNAVRYQDHLLGRIHDIVAEAPAGEVRSWLYVSDHGNEVGNDREFVGHSRKTAAGYAVPLLYWDSQPGARLLPDGQPIVTDTLDDNALQLLGIRHNKHRRNDDWFSPAYAWTLPPDWPPWETRQKQPPGG